MQYGGSRQALTQRLLEGMIQLYWEGSTDTRMPAIRSRPKFSTLSTAAATVRGPAVQHIYCDKITTSGPDVAPDSGTDTTGVFNYENRKRERGQDQREDPVGESRGALNRVFGWLRSQGSLLSSLAVQEGTMKGPVRRGR
jgi:hypothetical protein